MLFVQTEDDRLIPRRANYNDAGLDFYSNNEVFTLYPGDTARIHTGVRMAIPDGFVGLIVPRSSFGVNYHCTLSNTVGVIDSGYRDEILVYITNRGENPLKMPKYTKFCQMVIVPVMLTTPFCVDKETLMSSGVNRNGGFGSSGNE